ncbi:transcription factor E4F1-like isoform X2 [Physella acuta]|nr:transcription factor E4F1-like isoform X2 [Physella acuta]
MTELENDNNPVVDNNVSLIEFDVADQANEPEFGGEDDFFFCRKCNKIFKNLPQYLEHKVKDENFRIAQIRSKADKRMVLPRLVQKGKRKTKKQKNEDHTETSANIEPSESLPEVFVKQEQQPQDSTDILPMAAEPKPLNNQCLPKKRGRKKKSTVAEIQVVPEENSYICKLCDKKFRREATLRWHMTYDHKNKDKADESENSEDELIIGESDAKDEDFKVEGKDEEKDDDIEPKKEIHVIIEQSLGEVHQDQEKAQDSEKTGYEAEAKQKKLKDRKNETTERPFSCEVCGQSFKELTVLKVHALVHSDERKFVCSFENCPYAFKTKGGLVRHTRRHTGERPFACERCGRSFTESGALTRHLKARRNCSQTPTSAYPRYMKNWTYHPNIPAVVDPNQRSVRANGTKNFVMDFENQKEDIHYIVTEEGGEGVVTATISSPHVEGGIKQIVITQGHLAGQEPPALEKVVNQVWDAGAVVDDVNTLAGNEVVSTSGVTADVASVDAVETAGEATIAVSLPGAGPKGKQLEAAIGESLKHSTAIDSDLMDIVEVELLKESQCHVCKKDLKTVKSLEIHLRSHLADQPSRCGLCHFLSNDHEDLRKHILSLHSDSLNDIEASVLAMENDASNNKGEAMQDKKAVLRDALTAVKQLYSLRMNLAPSELDKPGPSITGTLQCMVCNRFFKGSNYLRQHMRIHTGDRPHQCHYCDRSFTSRDVLKKHMYVHTENRNFKCGECGKMFKRIIHVQQHLRIHSLDRSFRCNICEKTFKTQYSLKVHLRTHSGINPYKCQVCSRQFRERGAMQRHMRKHTGEKPFKCHLCHRAFAEQGTLSRHLKAKIPCSATRDADNMDTSHDNNGTMLAQFSSMVADTQHYILPEVDSCNQYVLSTDQELTENYVILQTNEEQTGEVVENYQIVTEENMTTTEETITNENQETETLEIYDSSTGESVIIVADKSIVDLVRDHQPSLMSDEGGTSLQKIKDILWAAGKGDITTSFTEGEITHNVVQEETTEVKQEEVITINSEADHREEETVINIQETSSQ